MNLNKSFYTSCMFNDVSREKSVCLVLLVTSRPLRTDRQIEQHPIKQQKDMLYTSNQVGKIVKLNSSHFNARFRSIFHVNGLSKVVYEERSEG